MATCNPESYLFMHIFCERGVNMFSFFYIYIVFEILPAYCFCSAIVLYCHFCVLSLTGVTLPALLSQWSYVLWRNSSSCLTVKRLTIHHLFLNHLFVNRMCTPNKAQDTKIQKKKKRWPRSFLLLQLNLGLLFLHSSITVLHSSAVQSVTDMHATGRASLDIKW